MAAGKGVRMRSSTPKVLHRVAGVPLVVHAVNAARHVNPTSTLAVVSPASRADVAAALGDGVECVEQPDPLGTGQALVSALAHVPADCQHVLLLNGDKPLLRGETVAELAKLHLKRHAAVTLLSATVSEKEAEDFGRVQRGARNKPIAVVEAAEARAAHAASVEVNVGVYAIDAAWLRGAIASLERHPSGEYYVTDLVGLAVAGGKRVEALVMDDAEEAIGVKTRALLARAEGAMQTRLRDAAMAGGATLLDPATTYLDATVELAQDVTVHPNTSISGATTIGAGATVGPNAQIVDSSVGPGATVRSAIVESSTLEAGSHVGPFSHLRAGTHLSEGAYVGTHVEVKASRVGRNTKIGHFSYIGDAVIGDDVNIGAGTVTCNYDGTTKHVTEIGDGAFIGSDSMLVAPVKVGAGAVTGAGAVVTHDVPPGATVAGMPARVLHPEAVPAGASQDNEGGHSLG